MSLRLIATAGVLLVLEGCGSSGYGEPRPQLDPPRATEPERGPRPEQPPAGQVVTVGREPEGVAVDPRSGLAAVAVRSPNRLVLLDVRAGEIRREVPLPGHARHVGLARAGGPFLVPLEDADQLVEVDPRTGAKRATMVGDYPHDATAVGDRLFTADEFGST